LDVVQNRIADLPGHIASKHNASRARSLTA